MLWFSPDGLEMSDDEWHQGFACCLGMYLAGDAIGESDAFGTPVADDDFLLLINAHHGEIPFVLRGFRPHGRWRVALDTARPSPDAAVARHPPGDVYRLAGRSLVLLPQPRARAGQGKMSPRPGC